MPRRRRESRCRKSDMALIRLAFHRSIRLRPAGVVTRRAALNSRALHARHHPQRQRHPRRGAQGLRALARARRAVGRRLPAGAQGAPRRRAAQSCARRASARRTSIPPRSKGYAGVGIYARAPATFATGFGSAEFDREGRYLEARLPRPHGDQRLPAVGIERTAPAGVEVPLPRRRSCRISRSCARAGARSSCAATGTSRTRTSTSPTGAATEALAASFPRSARG